MVPSLKSKPVERLTQTNTKQKVNIDIWQLDSSQYREIEKISSLEFLHLIKIPRVNMRLISCIKKANH